MEKDNFKMEKTSWDYIEEAENPKKIYHFNTKVEKKHYWESYAKGTKFKDKKGWWIKTDDGRKPLNDDDELLQPAIPLFCPNCGRIMKRDEDKQAYIHEKQCFICHIKQHAKENKEPGIKEFRRKLKILKDEIEKAKQKELEENDSEE